MNISFKFLIILIILTTVGCSKKLDKSLRSQSDDELIEALTYHHEFKVSSIIEELERQNNIDRKIETERVADSTNFWTPLSYASFIGNCKAVKLLIEKGADINYKDGNGQTPLILASIAGNIEEINLLLKVGANINEDDKDHTTALIHAAAEGNFMTVKYLIENGCEIETKTGGQNALNFAKFYQHKEIVNYLESKGLENSVTE